MAGRYRLAGTRHGRSRQSRCLCSRDPPSLYRGMGSYLAGDDAKGPGSAIFPALRRRGPLALVSVSSAVPTAPLMATGWLGQSQMDGLDRLLAALASEQAF